MSLEHAIAARKAGSLNEAKALIDIILQQKPTSPDAYIELGHILVAQGNTAEATDAYLKALELAPDDHSTHFASAVVLLGVGRVLDSIEHLRRAIDLAPSIAAYHTRLRRAFHDLGDATNANASAREAVRLGASAVEHSNLIFATHYDDRIEPELAYAEARRWASRHTRPSPPYRFGCDLNCDRRLRVGYLSSDLRDHPIGRLIHPVLKHHRKDVVETVVFSDSKCTDLVTRQLRHLADVWHGLGGQSDDQLVATVRKAEIDILVEMGGHFGGNRLRAVSQQMAPIQVSGFAYFGTTGVPEVSYRLTDPHSDPEGVTDRFYVERLVRLPHCCWCYRPFEPMPDVGPLPALANGYVTFGSLNNVIKLSPSCIGVWADILKRVERSKLLLLCREDSERRLRAEFSRAGVDKSLQFIRPTTRHGYLKAYRRIDIALDPFPFNGDNTTCDALWMGVPVLTLVGDSFASRRGVSHLTNTNCERWIAPDQAAYIDLASKLSADPLSLSHERKHLRSRFEGSVLADASRYVSGLENAYRQMWHRWCEVGT